MDAIVFSLVTGVTLAAFIVAAQIVADYLDRT